MWHHLWGLLLKPSVLFYTGLAFAVPFVTYQINRKLHGLADPPWKREEKGVDEDSDV